MHGSSKQASLIESNLRKTSEERIRELKSGGARGEEGAGSSNNRGEVDLRIQGSQTRYRMQLRCQEEPGSDPQPIKVEDILQDLADRKTESVSSKKGRRILVLGRIGTGKTALLMILTEHDLLKGKIIIFLKLSDFSNTKKVSPAHALISHYILNQHDIDPVFSWVKANPEKVAFIIDSLDDLPFDFNKEPPKIGFNDKAPMTDIVHSLLAGNLFPDSIVISSSRGLRVDKLHKDVQPDRCIHVDGLTRESIKEVLKELLGEEGGEEVNKILQGNFPELGQMLENPLFLCITAMAWKTGNFAPDVKASETNDAPNTKAREPDDALDRKVPKNDKAPDTITGIIANYINQCARSKHMSTEDISSLKKLIPKCLDEIQKGTPLSTLEDLREFSKRVEGGGLCVGVHIPHFLAAVGILMTAMEEFERIIPGELGKENLQSTRRQLYGVTFDKKIKQVCEMLGNSEIPDLEEKRDILSEDLRAFMREALKTENKSSLPEVFKILQQGGEGLANLIRSTMKDQPIDLQGVSLSSSDVNAIGLVLKYAEYLKCLNLESCKITEGKMLTLWEKLKSAHIKIGRFNISSNPDIGEKGMEYFGKITNHCEVEKANISSCSLKREHLRKFHAGSGDTKFSRLVASHNKAIGRGMYYLGILIKDEGCLIVSECHRDKYHVKDLCDGLKKDGKKKVNQLKLDESWSKPKYDSSLLGLISHVEKLLDINGWEIDESQKEQIRHALRATCKQTPLKVIISDDVLESAAVRSPVDVADEGQSKLKMIIDPDESEIDGGQKEQLRDALLRTGKQAPPRVVIVDNCFLQPKVQWQPINSPIHIGKVEIHNKSTTNAKTINHGTMTTTSQNEHFGLESHEANS